MRVGLNATCFDERPSGANNRFKLLYGALIRRNPQIHFVIYEPRNQPIASWFSDCTNITARRTPMPAHGRLMRSLIGRLWWPQALRDDGLDLFECFHLPATIAPACPTLLTLHDLRALRSTASWYERIVGRPVFRHALTRAACTIAVSDTIANEIQAFAPGVRTEVVFNGVDTAAFASSPSPCIAPSALPESFMLAVGHIETRKNWLLLVDAIALLRKQGKTRHLVLVGHDGGAGMALRARIEHHGIEDQVTILSNIDDQTLRNLYATCHQVIFPSRYEGFGIPLIEAMAAGRPVIASDIPVFLEISAGAALHFAVDSVEAAAEAVERVWNDEPLRQKLVAAGRERATYFSPDLLADRIAALYSKILSNRASAAPRL